MSRGRRISRVKFIPPSPKTAQKYLREWSSKKLYHQPEEFPKLSTQNLFDKPGELEMDIGCGTGEFLNAKAQANPRGYYLGIELSRRAVYHAVNQAKKLNLDNILYLRADFKLIHPLLSANSLNVVHLNFPDPNYGSRNIKHRIFTPDFLDNLHPALVQGGKIQVVTDQKPFLLDMLEIAENDPRYINAHKEKFVTTFDPIEKTRFQKAWERVERSFFRFELVKA